MGAAPSSTAAPRCGRLGARLAVVPGIVQLRIALAVALALLLLLSPQLLLPRAPLLALALQGALLTGLAYLMWCLWPWLRLGTEVAEPALPPQPLRLTFDDGPTPGVTDAVLDLLRDHGLRASFFVLVPKARAAPALIARMVAEGHVVGLHGEDHRAPFFRSTGELAATLGRGRAALAALTGRPVELYRPSHGWKNLALARALRRLGLRCCLWDLGVWDTDAPPEDVLLTRLRAAAAASPQVTILLHDGRGDEPGPPPHADAMLAALRRLLQERCG